MDEGKYQVENTDLVQGQNVGDHPQITQHFYGPGSKPAHPAPQEHIWNVPYRRNPFFTGREEVLNGLHEHYKQAKSVALTQPPAITGLGGIGKTQIAIEYAYRYRDDYQYVLWVNALSSETLLTEFITLADILELPQPEKDEHHQVRLTSMVKQWFSQHDHWLFILDNADNLPQVTPFLPTGDKGHILLTTRMSPTGTFTGLEVEKMDSEESMELLLGRAKFSLSEVDEYADQEALEALLKELDGLPLALGQAGAYIEETACTLVAYLKAYQQRRDELLQHRDELNADYPYTVTTTWSLNFEQIEGLDPLAADLLRFFAFLAPDAIPEEMIVESAVDLGTQIQVLAADATRLDKAIGILRRFSLVQRNREQRTISLHRLVQAVQKDSLDEDTQRLWAERVVLAVNRAFPDVDFLTWQRCQRCLPHALASAALIEYYNMTFSEARHLLYHAGLYLEERVQYEQAESLFQQALAIGKKVLGPDHPEVAQYLGSLGGLSYALGKYPQAEPLLMEAKDIRERTLEIEHPDTAESYNNLALLYHTQGKYDPAKALYEQAHVIWTKSLGPKHRKVATCLNNLAELYRAQGKLDQAESLNLQAKEIWETTLGLEHPDLFHSLNNLALVYIDRGKYDQAEMLYQQILLSIIDKLGQAHPRVGQTLNNLAELYRAQGKFDQAELLYPQAQEVLVKSLGPGHPEVANCLNNQAKFYQDQDKYDQAELLYLQATAINKQALGPDHPQVARNLNNLAALYYDQGKYDQAEPLFLIAKNIRQEFLGPDHPDVAQSLNNLAALYYAQGKRVQAEPHYQKAQEIWEKALGPKHPQVATVLENYANLLRTMKRMVEAVQLEDRARSIRAEYKMPIQKSYPQRADQMEKHLWVEVHSTLRFRKKDRKEKRKQQRNSRRRNRGR